jgi:nitroimidazol reductase NimA-like FMN-containing flavoprotein (pyridoxamine 5'-phosphate oxidase superfamily)
VEPRAVAKKIIDANKYMTLGTGDADGHPWVSPVYFTPDGYTDLYWISRPEARHSRNIAVRPDVSIVVFDSTVPLFGGEAVYVSARAGLVPDDEVERCTEIYNARLPELRPFRSDQPFRLYRARATEMFVLVSEQGDVRHPVELPM